MLFGKDNNRGIVLDGLKLKAVTLGEDGYTLEDVLVHNAHERDSALHQMLSLMKDELPVALGVIRDVAAPCYDEAVHSQLADVAAKKSASTLQEMLLSGETWTIN
jgi:2-oxoglutarate ferredoxin oxidoreductase subunit beta